MRQLLVAVCCLGLAGCGMTRQQEQMAADYAAQKPGMDACKAQYPDETKNGAARLNCQYEVAKRIRPYQPYPDLFDELWANGIVVAERLDAKKITEAEARLLLTQEKSKIAGEEQRRNLARCSVAAQESAAAAANSPVICNNIGTATICN
jgi:hypothetical protein